MRTENGCRETDNGVRLKLLRRVNHLERLLEVQHQQQLAQDDLANAAAATNATISE